MTGTRQEDRKSFEAELEVIVTGRLIAAETRNISAHGACVVCPFRLGRGDALQLDLSVYGAGVRLAVVRHARIWRERCVVGVEFFEPLSGDQLDALLVRH